MGCFKDYGTESMYITINHSSHIIHPLLHTTTTTTVKDCRSIIREDSDFKVWGTAGRRLEILYTKAYRSSHKLAACVGHKNGVREPEYHTRIQHKRKKEKIFLSLAKNFTNVLMRWIKVNAIYPTV